MSAIADLSAKASTSRAQRASAAVSARLPDLTMKNFDEKRDVGTKRLGPLFLSGTGTVLDSCKSRKGGSALHVVIKHGQVKHVLSSFLHLPTIKMRQSYISSCQVRVGDYFSAGGWSGKVKVIMNDGEKSIPIAYPGYAGFITVSVHPDKGDPRPMGDRIYFLSSSGKSSNGGGNWRGLSLSASQADKGAKAMAEFLMQQQQMELALGPAYLAPLPRPHFHGRFWHR